MVAKLIGVAAGQFLLAINRPLAVFGSTVAGMSANALTAWALIFGHLGFAPHGVLGSAWGQNVGVCVETFFLLAVIFTPGIRQTFGVLDARLRRRELLLLLKIGAGSGGQLVADVLAWSLFGMWVIGRFGTQAMAANTFMVRYMAVSFMPAYGISVAVTALVGRSIGAGNPNQARQWARLGFLLTESYMAACGLLFFFGRHLLISLFTHDPVIVRTGAMLLCFAAAYQLFDAFYIVFNGALRGAGDTLVPALAIGGFCWGITVFGGYAVARLFPAWGVAGPWSMEIIYGIVLGIFMWQRFARGRWRQIHLIAGHGTPAAASA
jgi:MATE family multidrug resistance protein